MYEDIRVLYICTRPKAYFDDPRNEDHYLWHAKAMSIDPSRFNVLYLPDQDIPQRIEEDIVIIGGSNKGVNDDLPWIALLEQCILQRVEEQKPLFGVCFGHQIIAKALGGKVEVGKNGPEIGVTELAFTEKGVNDSLFKGIEAPFDVMQFHKDTVVELPPGDVQVLAESQNYNFQALSYGLNIKTVQFHPEMTNRIMRQEIQEHKEEMLRLGYFANENEVSAKLDQGYETNCEQNGQTIYQNFLKNLKF